MKITNTLLKILGKLHYNLGDWFPHPIWKSDIRYLNRDRGAVAAGYYLTLKKFDPNFTLKGDSGFAVGFNSAMRHYRQSKVAKHGSGTFKFI